jgi:hypothetical protein
VITALSSAATVGEDHKWNQHSQHNTGDDAGFFSRILLFS